MKHYHRLVRFSSMQLDQDAERLELAELLKNVPGLSVAELIGSHPKGGYRVTFDLPSARIDALISRFEEAGWRSAL